MSIQKILLIEDNKADQKFIFEHLKKMEKLPVSVEIAETLSESLMKMRGQQYDCVLLDLNLPDCMGLDTLTQFVDANMDTPVVIITGIDDENAGARAVSKGAQDYIVKGHFNSYILSRSITYAKERQKLLKQRDDLIKELGDASNKITTLSGIIPICMHCKKIRDDKGYWEMVEVFLKENSQVEFNQVLCPECRKKQFPDQFSKIS
jgi:CheY-like chemotaxis protein